MIIIQSSIENNPNFQPFEPPSQEGPGDGCGAVNCSMLIPCNQEFSCPCLGIRFTPCPIDDSPGIGILGIFPILGLLC